MIRIGINDSVDNHVGTFIRLNTGIPASASMATNDRLAVSLISADEQIPRSSNFALLRAVSDVEIEHVGRTTSLRAGELMLVDRLLPVEFGGNAHWSAYLMDLGSRRIADMLGNDRRFLAVPFGDDGSLVVVINRLCDLVVDIDRLGVEDMLAESGLTDVLTNFIARMVSASFDWKASRHSAATLDRARQYIRAHFNDADFNVSGLAARMGMSTRHLSTIFAEAGTTIAREIALQRMRHASSLLTDRSGGTRQIAEIARACGFDDQTQFGRSFKRQFGETPRAFRRRIGSQYQNS